MFVHTQETLVLSQACILSLNASMNAPVVNMDELPVAPARAAIVVYAEEYGDLGLALAVRSMETGQVALYRYRGRVTTGDPDGEPMQDAQSFGEGLGFLFDDDMLAEDTAAAREAAFEHWNHLMGLSLGAPSGSAEPGASIEPGSVPAVSGVVEDLLEPVAAAGLAQDAPLELDRAAVIEPELELIRSAEPGPPSDDLLLDDLVGLDGDDDLSLELDAHPATAEPSLDELAPDAIELSEEPAELEAPPVEAAAQQAAPAAPEVVPLTKFRRPAETEEEDDAGGAALGRIPIVRRKQGDKSKPSYLGRLLASF